MAALILTKRGLLRHPAFAFTEAPRTGAGPLQIPGAAEATAAGFAEITASIAQLRGEIEKAGKNLYRFATQQESVDKDIHAILEHLKRAGQAEAVTASPRQAEKFLPLIDALHRLARVLSQWENGVLAEGVQMVLAKGEAYLASLGIEAIPAAGQRFDPRLHEALEVRQAAPEMEGFILEEIVRGYRMGSKILRAAQVVVGKQESKWTK